MEQIVSRRPRGSIWKNLLYSSRFDITDRVVLQQLFFINTFSLLGFLSTEVFGIIHILNGNYSAGVPEISGGIVFLLNMLVLRVSKNINLAKSIMLLTQGAMLLVLLGTGGIAHTGIYWFFTFPICAFFLMGKHKGMVWICLLYIATLVVVNSTM